MKKLIIVLVFILVSIGLYYKANIKVDYYGIDLYKAAPKNALEKYNEFKDKYEGADTYLTFCKKDNHPIYVVETATGYITESYFYEFNGKYLGNSYESDNIDIGVDETGQITSTSGIKQAPVDLSEYNCQTIRKS